MSLPGFYLVSLTIFTLIKSLQSFQFSCKQQISSRSFKYYHNLHASIGSVPFPISYNFTIYRLIQLIHWMVNIWSEVKPFSTFKQNIKVFSKT